MSQENVEHVRAVFEAWNAGDMDALRKLYDPNIVVRYAEGWPEGSEPTLGREAVVRQWEQSAKPGMPTPLNRSASSTPGTESS